MSTKKGGNKKVAKTLKAQDNQRLMELRSFKSVTMAKKRAQKLASSSNRFLNSQDIQKPQAQALVYERVLEGIQMAFNQVNSKFEKLVNQKQKLIQTLQKKKGDWKKYQDNLQQKKDLYKLWLKEMKNIFDQYSTYLELDYEEIKAEKQMTESKSTKQKKWDQLKKDISQLKLQQIALSLNFEKRINSIRKNNYENQMEIAFLKENFYNKQLYQKKKKYIDMISEASNKQNSIHELRGVGEWNFPHFCELLLQSSSAQQNPPEDLSNLAKVKCSLDWLFVVSAKRIKQCYSVVKQIWPNCQVKSKTGRRRYAHNIRNDHLIW